MQYLKEMHKLASEQFRFRCCVCPSLSRSEMEATALQTSLLNSFGVFFPKRFMRLGQSNISGHECVTTTVDLSVACVLK